MKKLFIKSIRYYSSQKSFPRVVLGIECSCDDTAVGVVNTNRQILAESHRNQWIHHKIKGSAPNFEPKQFGGIIPNLAANLHNQYLGLCVSDCIEKLENGWNSIDTIALSVKPGLEICLWQGIKFTKLLLNKNKNKSFIPIHHMESHALTPRLFESNLKYPYIAILMSGGHTICVLVCDCETFLRFGETTNLAIGNCIDKVARRLGLYQRSSNDNLSGGALIEKYALGGNESKYVSLHNKMKNYCGNNRDCNFSYGGLYTAVISLIINLEKQQLLDDQTIMDICASFQSALMVQLQNRLERSIIYYNTKIKNHENQDPIDIVIAGGVASNKYIFNGLREVCKIYGNKLIVPPIKYCTDNGVMIAWDGIEKAMSNSDRIISYDKSKNFLESLKPESKSRLGTDISLSIKMADIKIKMK